MTVSSTRRRITSAATAQATAARYTDYRARHREIVAAFPATDYTRSLPVYLVTVPEEDALRVEAAGDSDTFALLPMAQTVLHRDRRAITLKEAVGIIGGITNYPADEFPEFDPDALADSVSRVLRPDSRFRVVVQAGLHSPDSVSFMLLHGDSDDTALTVCIPRIRTCHGYLPVAAIFSRALGC